MLTQGLSVHDLFLVDEGHVQRKLHALDTPVRAVVAPLHDPHAERVLSAALQVRTVRAAMQSCSWRAGRQSWRLHEPKFTLTSTTCAASWCLRRCTWGFASAEQSAGMCCPECGCRTHCNTSYGLLSSKQASQPASFALLQGTHSRLAAVQEYVLPIVGQEGVWLQDYTMLHSTLFHASSHKVRCYALQVQRTHGSCRGAIQLAEESLHNFEACNCNS